MLAKKQKAKLTHFSSEDSQNTDHSMNSSLEISESNAQNNHANKFNQLRETMNQLFLANPELAEEIKFERYLETGEPEGDSPRNMPASPLKKATAGSHDHLASGNEEAGGNISSAKFWGAISKEMTKPQKNSKMPSINQINHILNIYKAKFEKPEQTEMSLSPPKSVLKKPKSEFRIQSAKVGGDKQLLSSRLKDGKQGAQNNSNQQEEGEDGVNYYSFRKKMHLKLKQKRIEQELEEQRRNREEAERERLAKEREQKQLQTLTYPDVGDEIKKAASIMKLPSMKLDIENQPGEASTRHGTRIIKPRGSGSRRNSVKGKGDIFERLTKDFTNKNAATEEDDENHPKRTFTSPFAESLYNDMKAFGDPEAFKKIAQARINNYKKEFKEKLSKQKQLPLEGLRFSKDKSRYLNMYVPDFEKAAAFPNKDMIFNVKEIQKDSEEWKENADYETLAKFQKIRSGNILEFWQESKDLNQ